MTGEEIAQRIRLVARRFFAELGYDGTDLKTIADAVGLSMAEVQSASGGKRELYLRVFRDLVDEQAEFVAPAVAEFTQDLDGVIRLIDRYVFYNMENRELLALWVQRWLSDAADFKEVERIFWAPPAEQLADVMRPALREDVDVYPAIWMIVWSTYGFLTGGMLVEGAARLPPDSPEGRRRFLAQIHRYLATLVP
ncbi:AcrR family transcriptional regulator [Actinocorallia herbida]|uniref:AcrR family transcriptional regulator n=1 Tax=Actinocorallia herbida TaxID=58109 RepID=A0A3N1D2Z0_9ACTN|nr:TetR/AcrR family transcriptional regulator [Actinocorallia herbida]ROO87846.1 AcrR family transcriptional regulator [Actinocorallia herbida]